MSVQQKEVLCIEKVSKRFGGVQALSNVSFSVYEGEVHALVGENGAGKSTLMNILGGIISKDSGTITFKGQPIDFASPQESMAAGIAVIHQELAMLPSLNVVANLFMGRMPARYGLISWKDLEEKTREILALVGLDWIDIHTPVRNLSISQRQLIEIAKAISMEASLIIMDEPNSSLSEAETRKLFSVIKDLQQRKVSIIYVSHKIEEVLEISQRISVLRDGKYIGILNKDEATVDKIIHMMVGRDLLPQISSEKKEFKELILEVKHLSGSGFSKVSFDIYKGEILGFAGLVGAGRSELARAIFAADEYTEGEVWWKNKKTQWRSPAEAIKSGIAMVAEDRKVLSLFMGLPILFNMSIANAIQFSPLGLLDHHAQKELANHFIKRLNIKLGALEHPVRSLSGGNQQKTILARWLAVNPQLLILDEPTHGVDVGAKAEIYQLIRELAEQGVSIMLISSELPEIIALCDRCVVMCEGTITKILEKNELEEKTIMRFATGLIEERFLQKSIFSA